MAGVNIRESRRAAHPASKYDGVNSFETDRIPVAYTADQLMRHLAKRQMEEEEKYKSEEQQVPSYIENMLAGAALSMDSSIYDKYKPQRQYSYADRLAALKAAAPENRAAILEMTAPTMLRMKKGWGALGEAILPAAIAGTTYANTKAAEYDQQMAAAKRQAAAEKAKEARKREREYLKHMLKKEAAIEKQTLKSEQEQERAIMKILAARELASMKAASTRYAADKAYEAKKFNKKDSSEKDEIALNNTLEETEELLKQFEEEGIDPQESILNRIPYVNQIFTPSPAQAAYKAQEDKLRLFLAKKMGTTKNKTEFEHTPSISARNSLEVNKAILDRLKDNKKVSSIPNNVKMVAPDGSTRNVPADQVEYWKSKNARVVNE